MNGAALLLGMGQGCLSHDEVVTSASNPIRTVATQNNIAVQRSSRSGKSVHAFRQKYVMGTNASELLVNLNNWYMSTTGEAATPAILNDITFADMALEDAAGNMAPVFFGGGRSITLSAGAYDVLSDKILPSSLLKASFSLGDEYFIKGKITVATGAYVPTSPNTVNDAGGQQCWWYDPAVTSVSSTDTPGAYSRTGAVPDQQTSSYRPILLGRPLVDGPSFAGIGDSIMEGTGDNSNAGQHGRGFFNRAMRTAEGAALYPGLNMAKHGASILLGQTRRLALCKYARFAVDEIGTNAIGADGNGNAVTIGNNIALTWAELRAAGIEKIVRTYFTPRTNSTDSWTTLENQTYSGAWGGVNNVADLLHARFETELSNGVIDAVCMMDGIRAPEDWWKFKVNGTANYTAYDNTHPAFSGMEFMAADLRAVLATL